MTHRAQRFRLCYFGQFGTVHEVEIAARNAVTAIGKAREVQWPNTAIGIRIVDCEGREVFEQLRFDPR